MLHGGIHGGLTADWLFTPFGPAIVTALIRPPPRPPRLGVSGGATSCTTTASSAGWRRTGSSCPSARPSWRPSPGTPPRFPQCWGPGGGHIVLHGGIYGGLTADWLLAPFGPAIVAALTRHPPALPSVLGPRGGATSCSAAASTAG